MVIKIGSLSLTCLLATYCYRFIIELVTYLLCLEKNITILLSHGTVRYGFCSWCSLESTQMTAVYMIQRHSRCEMLLFVWASNLEEIFLRVVFLRLLGWGSVGFLLHDSELCVNSESHRFRSQCVENYLWWCCCIRFLFLLES